MKKGEKLREIICNKIINIFTKIMKLYIAEWL